MSPELNALIELHRYVTAGKQPRITLTYDAPATHTINAAISALMTAEQRLLLLEPVVTYYADTVTWLKVPAATLAAADKGEKARVALSAYQSVRLGTET
jgi:hypothetical protein